MAGLKYEEFVKSTNCERAEIISTDTSEHISRLTEITERVLAERSAFSNTMFYIQPYHLAAPPINLVGAFPEKKYIGVRYDLMHFCLNEKKEVINEQKKESVMIWANVKD